MSAWTNHQLDTIAHADELEVITLRRDGSTRGPVVIWVVRVEDDIVVRSFRGEKGAWYRHARVQGTGWVRVAGMSQAVTFEPVTDRATIQAIDEAYRTKYARYSDTYVQPMVAQAAQVATLRLIPRDN